MLLLDVHVNIFAAAGLVVVAAVVSFLVRASQVSSLKGKIQDLEKEMLSCHAEILQLQKEKIDLLKSISEPSIPVIPINAPKDKEETASKLPDVGNRKKLLSGNAPVKQQSGS
jgi:hypothetical protein